MNDKFDENEIHHELYIHLVWSTKNQQLVLSAFAQYLYHYMCELALSNDCYVINGRVFSDYVQLIVKFSPDISLDDLMTNLKVATSLLIRTNFPEMRDFEWQKSNFAFSVGSEEACSIIDNNAQLFHEEICNLLNRNGLEFKLHEVLE